MEDISKTTISVLLILVVLISVIGTWVVLNTLVNINNQPYSSKVQSSQTGGNVRLFVLNPQGKTTSSDGNVQITVLNPQKEEV